MPIVPTMGDQTVTLNGHDLTIEQIVSVARYGAKVALGANGSLALTPTCSPQLRTNQRVSLILGGTEALADTFNAATATPTFHFEGLLPSTAYRVRLRVDGVDSLIVDRAATPPVFVGPQVETLP